jgi:hypothetical protein
LEVLTPFAGISAITVVFTEQIVAYTVNTQPVGPQVEGLDKYVRRYEKAMFEHAHGGYEECDAVYAWGAEKEH